MNKPESGDKPSEPQVPQKKGGFFDRVKSGLGLSDEEKARKETEKQQKLREDYLRRQALEQAKLEEAKRNTERLAEKARKAAEDKAAGRDLMGRLKTGLKRTNQLLHTDIAELFSGKEIDDELLEELETRLLLADVGVDATTEIIDSLTARVSRKELKDPQALYLALQEELVKILQPCEAPLSVEAQDKPFVIMMVGVNGVGKTTTIGKLAKRLQSEGKSVMLAAGDTFRAAAVEQLQVWGERNEVPVVAQHTGADSASVVYDAVASARAKNIDVLIADTAGRLHNKSNLMEELNKVKRVAGKLDAAAPHEVMLVLDAGTGQNAVSQAEQFKNSAGVTSLALTKLDGTAKGGVIFALSKKLGLPIRFVGVGEGVDDLQPFEAKAFVDALFAQDSSSDEQGSESPS